MADEEETSLLHGRVLTGMETESSTMDSGQQRLQDLGYKQELKRDLSVLSNFAFSFAIISILTGITTLFNTGLNYGGTVSMVYGWLIVGVFTLFVGASMAEICSAFPTSGGLYYWSSQLAGPRWGPFASWITGWYNVVGQWAVTTSVDFSLAQLIAVMVLLGTGGANGGGYVANKYVVIGIHGGILLSHALINSLSISWLSYFGVFVLIVLIPAVAKEHQSLSSVFTTFIKPADVGIDSSPYIFLLGLLISQYTITGYDASAHMSEETKSSDKNGAYGILSAIIISLIVGWGYILGLSFVVIDPAALLNEANDAGGYAVAQVFYNVFKARYGSGTGGIVCLGIVGVAIYFCGMSSITSNSRMVYAFSRDGAMPFSRCLHQVNRREVPLNAVWVSSIIAFCMALTSLGSLVAFQAMVSIATIGLYISYALPILFRVTIARKSFHRGPFNLGRYGEFVGWVAVLWVALITVLFCLPVVYPVTKLTLNYAPVAVGGVFVLVLGVWVLSARKWFKGPQFNVVSPFKD
ncbi:amino-acid permease BAT1 homolog isoform X2 [Physcomitrium patens]|uniref:amino-acid permease BAT1 homolog isoform X2 n=1 Tax=Physcomitrium patens TaxID=3218 RepID=UPI000D16903A|nr:amino-acid permease BAT1 homolog isoform X2 [Physcomitrium patens]|eukprot:XP_024370470.1 amino-acid permease BAT1 homolog isoform X2 [Physcomitrella patens]